MAKAKKTVAKKQDDLLEGIEEGTQEHAASLEDYELELLLGPQRVMFCHHYVRMNNQTHAAKAAGYGEKRATQQGCRLYRNVYVRELVRRKQSDIAKEIGVSPIMLAEKLKNIATASMNDFNTDWDKRKEWKDVDVDKIHAISELYTSTKTYIDDEGVEHKTTDVKIKLKDSMKANTELMEFLGYKKEVKEEEKEEADLSKMTPEELAVFAKYGIDPNK